MAVIDDLYAFAMQHISGSIPYNKQHHNTTTSYQQTLEKIQHSVSESNTLSNNAERSTVVHTEVPLLGTHTIHTHHVSNESFKVGYQYFTGSIDTPFYQDPVRAFDGVLKIVPYGTKVRLVSLKGRWAQVRIAGRVGWIFKDVLIEDANGVYPRFVTDMMYGADNQQTIKLRKCIDDAFAGEQGGHPLSAAEYVHYRLLQKRRKIDWGDIRMRIPGTWQRKLRGNSGVHIGIEPKTESVMEYHIDDLGYLAFVEAVFPDKSIHITQIDKAGTHQYTDEMLLQNQWRELRPVFIAIL